MRRTGLFATTLACLAFGAQANDGIELAMKGKSLAAASVAAASAGSVSASPFARAPFASGRDPLPYLAVSEEQEQRATGGGCAIAQREVCYDAASGQVVYRPARKYMPHIEGLTPENVSLRRNRLVFTYSFK